MRARNRDTRFLTTRNLKGSLPSSRSLPYEMGPKCGSFVPLSFTAVRAARKLIGLRDLYFLSLLA